MRFSESDSEQRDWYELERRLRRIEDAVIGMQTVVNLLRDLLERMLPPAEGGDEEARDGE